MGEQKRPLKPGEASPAFTLPAANRAGNVSLEDLRGKPFLIGFFRGLHCPFCRRQVVQLGAVQPALSAAGIETLAVINTPVDRARLYARHRPTPVTLLSDPDCLTHQAFGVPHARLPARRQHRAGAVALQDHHGAVHGGAHQPDRRDGRSRCSRWRPTPCSMTATTSR